MAKAQADQSSPLTLTHAPNKWFDDPWTCPPCHMKARNGVAMPGSKRAPALSPLQYREEANTLCMEPGILLACGKTDIGFCPAAGPEVFFPIKSGTAEPVLQGKVV